MMTCIVDDTHPPLVIPRLFQLLYTRQTTCGVHPVLVAIYTYNEYVAGRVRRNTHKQKLRESSTHVCGLRWGAERVRRD